MDKLVVKLGFLCFIGYDALVLITEPSPSAFLADIGLIVLSTLFGGILWDEIQNGGK